MLSQADESADAGGAMGADRLFYVEAAQAAVSVNMVRKVAAAVGHGFVEY